MHLSIALLALPLLTAAFPFPLPYLSSRSSVIARRNLTSNTQNDLVDGLPCKKITVIFARGTVSPGNMGTNVGPPFVQAIGALVGVNNIAVQGVDYPASILGFLEGGDANGSILMANLTTQAITKCPSSKVVMSGYSQGGQLVHKAANLLSASVTAKVSSVVIFGDPLNGTAVGKVDPSKVLVVCHAQDLICKGTWIVDSEHLDYANDAGTAAAFVVAKAEL